MEQIPRYDKNVLPPLTIIILMAVTFFFVAIVGSLFVLIAGSPLGLLSEAFIVLPTLIYVISKKLSVKGVFRLYPFSPGAVFSVLGLSFSSIIIIDEVDRLVMKIFPMPEFLIKALEEIIKVDGLFEFSVLIIAVVIMAALAEEMIFRGMIQKSMESVKDPANAIVITAVIFAVVHFNPWTAFQITLIGVVMGYMAWKSNSIYPSIILHGLNNLFSVIMINLPEQKVNWYASGDHVNMGWLVLAIILGPVSFYLFNQHFSKNL